MDNLSKTEWIIALILLPITIALAIFLNPIFKAPMIKELNIYRSALKNDNNPELFAYEKETNSGNILAYGEAESLTPVSIPELTQPQSIIVRITQRYNRHTRLVTHTSCSGSGKSRICTSHTTTQIYYSWDSNGIEKWNSTSYKFLGTPFTSEELYFLDMAEVPLNKETVNSQYHAWMEGNYLYNNGDKWANVGDLRFYYRYLPIKFHATIFFRFMDNKVYNPVNVYKPSAEIFYEMTINQIFKDKENAIVVFDYWYYPLWIIAIECLWLGFSYKLLEL